MTLNDVLFAIMCLTAAYARSALAAVFCTAYALHSFYSAEMAQWLRYVALILIDSGVAFAAVAVKRPSRGTVLTGAFSGAFLVANSVGFVLWYNYFPPATYDAVCSVVYIAMMAAFIDEGSNGRLRLAVYRLAGYAPRVAVRKGVGLHHKDADKI